MIRVLRRYLRRPVPADLLTALVCGTSPRWTGRDDAMRNHPAFRGGAR